MINYRINSTFIYVEGCRYKSYGIDIYDDKTLLNAIFDISTNKLFVQELIYKCNSCDAAPEHIMDIIYDFIE